MKRVSTLAVGGLAAASILGLLLGVWLEYRRGRLLAAHFERSKAYAARTIERLGTLPDELRESSGLALSRAQPAVLWSHNDSGDGPLLYAFDRNMRLLAAVRVEGAGARDWEDLASGPCPAGVPGANCLYVADTGNNTRDRDVLTIYVLPEPRLDAQPVTPAVRARAIRFRYPDTPLDSEALAVMPDGGLTIVSKGRSGTVEFFGLSREDIARALITGETLTIARLGRASIEPDGRIGRLVTGAAISPDGTTLAVRTYNEIFFYRAAGGPDARRWEDLGQPCALGDAEPQGEAVAYLDERTLLLTSERAFGRPGELHRVLCW